ncbi:uncharacterized protein LOC119735289 [Patiria miniata]|uniref:Uncharacterized protein n=1 Tax=Patiria miniata TaxID=46514 RepID=A0A914AN32_PATMI|nr:uncharacterized protein LOC119735289 [Patiria miniata]
MFLNHRICTSLQFRFSQFLKGATVAGRTPLLVQVLAAPQCATVAGKLEVFNGDVEPQLQAMFLNHRICTSLQFRFSQFLKGATVAGRTPLLVQVLAAPQCTTVAGKLEVFNGDVEPQLQAMFLNHRICTSLQFRFSQFLKGATVAGRTPLLVQVLAAPQCTTVAGKLEVFNGDVEPQLQAMFLNHRICTSLQFRFSQFLKGATVAGRTPLLVQVLAAPQCTTVAGKLEVFNGDVEPQLQAMFLNHRICTSLQLRFSQFLKGATVAG